MGNLIIENVIGELNKARNEFLLNASLLEKQIAELKHIVNPTLALTESPSNAAPSTVPTKPTKKKFGNMKYARNTGPINLRVREIMFDGIPRSAEEIRQHFNLDKKQDPETYNKYYSKINSAISWLVETHYLLRIRRGVYRRNLKGVKNTTKPPKSSYRGDTLKSHVVNAVDNRSGELTTREIVKELDGVLEEKYPNTPEKHRINKISTALYKLFEEGKLIRLRPGVYTLKGGK